ncbi:MAG: hypothetical protein WCK42_08635 [Myxococcaceae bacterium]
MCILLNMNLVIFYLALLFNSPEVSQTILRLRYPNPIPPSLDTVYPELHQKLKLERQEYEQDLELASNNHLVELPREPIKTLHQIASYYSWAIPDERSLRIIASYSPLIEIGAGSGYWAHSLTKYGADILAFDDFSWTDSNTRLWFDVTQGSTEKIPLHLNRTLFLCWPPAKSSFAYEALKAYQGTHFIYIGELFNRYIKETGRMTKPAMGNTEFFKLLREKYNLVSTTPINTWPGYFDELHIFSRRAVQE